MQRKEMLRLKSSVLVLGTQPSTTCPCEVVTSLKALEERVRVLEWKSYSVTVVLHVHRVVRPVYGAPASCPKRRDTCRGPSLLVAKVKHPPFYIYNHSKIYKFISFIDFIILK